MIVLRLIFVCLLTLFGSQTVALGQIDAYCVATNKIDNAPIQWPPNRGFESSGQASLIPGTKVDRFGSNSGTFVAPDGTPFPQRSLPDGFQNKPLNTFEVLKPIEVDAGPSAPWFNQPGGGLQFELPGSVDDLINSGHLRQL